jgi:PDZ domain
MNKQKKNQIDRRAFLCGAAGTVLAFNASLPQALGDPLKTDLSAGEASSDNCLFVSTSGSDSNPGTESRPLRTFRAAQKAVAEWRRSRPGAMTVYFRSGTYYLPDTIVFTSEDSGEEEAPIVYTSYPGEQAVLSGGNRIKPKWKPYRDGILQTPVPPGTDTDQLFVNGRRQVLARYPNYDPNAKYLNGWAADAISPERVKRWSDPRGGYIHALHEYLWGSLSYEITGKDANGNLTYVGGWQTNRPAPMHKEYRYVENIFEELDAPGEWFLDKKKNVLYYYPPQELDVDNAVVEVVRLKHLVEMRGTAQAPVKWISLRNFTFRHTLRTFMETREPLLRSDWCIYRGGALFFTGTEDCGVEQCMFDQLGGNCIFVSNYNRRIHAVRCHLAEACANGIAFVGDPNAVRSPLFNYAQRHTIDELDLTPGPKSDNYPKDCIVDDCLIYRTGRVEKQTAPIEIDMAHRITVRHVSAYDVPRAGINIGDGCWGGHHIDFCDIFDTVMETGDHGSFNSWGRDRWWQTKGLDFDTLLSSQYADLPVLDVIEPNTLSNSRWRCDHGWDIDLDDGSTNYHIYNNLCLNGGLKLREGFYRTCENNVLVSNSLHAHVWFNDSLTIFRSNIVCTPYRPIGMRKWTQQIDYNLLDVPGMQTAVSAKPLQKLSGQDEHSLEADAHFIDIPGGDYNVHTESPALQLGFINFDMQNFGVQSPELKAIARTPELPLSVGPKSVSLDSTRSRVVVAWEGTKVRNIVGLDEVSAAGTPGETGVIILEAPANTPVGKAALMPGDVILGFNKKPVNSVQDLLRYTRQSGHGSHASITILRFQQESSVSIQLQ